MHRPRTHLSARSCWATAMAISGPGEWVVEGLAQPGPGRGHRSLPSSHRTSQPWSQVSPEPPLGVGGPPQTSQLKKRLLLQAVGEAVAHTSSSPPPGPPSCAPNGEVHTPSDMCVQEPSDLGPSGTSSMPVLGARPQLDPRDPTTPPHPLHQRSSPELTQPLWDLQS